MSLLALKTCRLNTTPDLDSYDKFIVFMSGGKDSLACLLRLLKLGVDKSKIELWHHCVDGKSENTFMDWPVTESYCKAIAAQFEIPIFFSWRDGGFLKEMLRNEQATGPVVYETPIGLMRSGGNGKPNTRRKFPQVSADLRVRWCSAYLKIDVAAAALRNQVRFRGIKTLAISGERAQESPARSKYATFERHRSDARDGKLKRHIDHWRPVHDWDESDVWEIIEEYQIAPHPAYQLGFGRLSCMTCIFASSNQWSSVKFIAPEHFERIAKYEEEFGVTIQRKYDVRELAEQGTVYSQIVDQPELVELATTKKYCRSIFVEEWTLPAGAFGESTGPS